MGSEPMMTVEQALEVHRRKILNGEEVSIEELRQAIRLLRQDRISSAETKKPRKATVEVNLEALFQ
jgi:hypothetical protein